MENNLTEPEIVSTRDCANCGNPAMHGDHPTPLCHDCRSHFTRLSIPLWIKLFAGGICVILLFSLFTFPKTLSMGIHLRRGEKAVADANYNTAEKELKQVLVTAPDNIEANGNLLIAAFYNQDYGILGKEIDKLQSKKIEDQALYDKIDETLTRAGHYVPNDSFAEFEHSHPVPEQAADSAWENYLARNPQDCFAMMRYASVLFDRKDYVRCDSFARRSLKIDFSYFPALLMETSIKRETGDMEGSLGFCRMILDINHESAYGLATEARTLLRQKKDKQALELAVKANQLKPGTQYVEASLILAYHFNNRATDRDALFVQARREAADSSDKAAIQYAQDVIDHKEKFRD